MRRRYFILLLAVLLPSCVREQFVVRQPEHPLSEKTPIMVEPRLPEGWEKLSTKAASDIQNIDTNEELQAGGIGVYAYYTGASAFSSIKRSTYGTTTGGSYFNPFGVVFYNREFSHNGSSWANAGVDEFWPMTDGENLTLFSYAPYDVWSGYVQTDTTRYDVPFIEVSTDNFLASDMSVSELEAQKDILWGTNTSGLTHKNVSKSQAHYSSGLVDMHLRHAMAKVGFQVAGSLASETLNFIVSSSSQTKQGETETVTGKETISDRTPTTGNVTRGSTEDAGWGRTWDGDNRYRRPYTVTRTYSQDKTYTQTETEYYLVTETGRIERQGTRYMIEDVSLKGFNKKGVLLLDNAIAYEPTWKDTVRFGGSAPEYVISDDNVLATALKAAPAGTIAANPGVYTGIQDNFTDLMDGYFLYAIPREATVSDKIGVILRYRVASIEGTSNGSRSRLIAMTRSRDITTTRTHAETKTIYRYRSSNNNWPAANSVSIDEFEFSDTYTFTDEAWGTERVGSWTAWTTTSEDDWIVDPNETSPSYDVSYYEGDPVTLHGSVVTSLQGGYEYTVRLLIAGNTLDIIVAPNPWDLTDTDFNYASDINEPIQKLDYDSATIDYVEGREVYINNRVAKFSFLLGEGRYNAWSARFVGSPGAFGFTDENGQFILDANGEIAASIRGTIDPSQVNYIYIKARNIPAPVTSKATLRIYYLDPSGKATVALNLVETYNEWTIVQNAN